MCFLGCLSFFSSSSGLCRRRHKGAGTWEWAGRGRVPGRRPGQGSGFWVGNRTNTAASKAGWKLESWGGQGKRFLLLWWDSFRGLSRISITRDQTRHQAAGFPLTSGIIEWLSALEKEMTPDSSILAWRIPRTEEPRGLQIMGSQKSRVWISN